MIQYLVIFGALVSLVGIFSYIKDTLSGKTKPNRISWLMWSIAPLIATAAALSDGVHWAVLPVFMSGFGPFLVFIVSFVNKQAYWKLELFDYLCGAFSAVALVLWWVTKDPVIAIGFAIVSDFSALIPTLLKAWKHPETETVDAFTTGLFSALTSFPAIIVWTLSSYAFPLYLVFANSLLIFAITRKKLFKP